MRRKFETVNNITRCYVLETCKMYVVLKVVFDYIFLLFVYIIYSIQYDRMYPILKQN